MVSEFSLLNKLLFSPCLKFTLLNYQKLLLNYTIFNAQSLCLSQVSSNVCGTYIAGPTLKTISKLCFGVCFASYKIHLSK